MASCPSQKLVLIFCRMREDNKSRGERETVVSEAQFHAHPSKYACFIKSDFHCD